MGALLYIVVLLSSFVGLASLFNLHMEVLWLIFSVAIIIAGVAFHQYRKTRDDRLEKLTDVQHSILIQKHKEWTEMSRAEDEKVAFAKAVLDKINRQI